MRRYNNGKGKTPNFTQELIIDTLKEYLLFNADQESLLVGVESHGLTAPEPPDWQLLDQAIAHFAQQVMRKEAKHKK